MRITITKILSLVAVLSSLTNATQAQLVVWSTTNFVDDPLGPYGGATDFAGGAIPALNIVTPGESGGSSQALELSFDATSGTVLNFQTTGVFYPASGNTNSFLANYTVSFDMQVNGANAGPIAQGFQFSIFGPNGSVFGPPAATLSLTTNIFLAGTGYQHYSFPLSSFANNGFDPTTNSMSFGIGLVSYPANFTAAPETFDFDNLQITMATNPPPPPRPTLTIHAANPGVRIFGQNYAFTYNQEGFGTVDNNQSWVGVATSTQPVKYSINIGDFDTVDNYTLYAQFVANGSVNPYTVFESPNVLVWSITHVTGGFTTGVSWKTNAPAAGETNNPITLTTTSLNGRGTWTLAFTSDTNGTVTAPDGTTGAFTLPSEDVAQLLANPMDIMFGTAPNNTQGYGQYIDIDRITITNVTGANEDDNFTVDQGLDPSQWDPTFSLDAGSVIQVATNTPYWLSWTIPDQGFTLGTKADLKSAIPWYTPDYYGGGTYTNTTPTQMGPSQKWTLISSGCLPTVDGTVGGPVTNRAFFHLSDPAPIQ